MAKLTCPNCGKPVRPGARFCGYCKYDLSSLQAPPPDPPPPAQSAAPQATPVQGMPAQTICPACGTANKPTARFCHSCGQALSVETAPPLPATAPPPPPAAPEEQTMISAPTRASQAAQQAAEETPTIPPPPIEPPAASKPTERGMQEGRGGAIGSQAPTRRGPPPARTAGPQRRGLSPLVLALGGIGALAVVALLGIGGFLLLRGGGDTTADEGPLAGAVATTAVPGITVTAPADEGDAPIAEGGDTGADEPTIAPTATVVLPTAVPPTATPMPTMPPPGPINETLELDFGAVQSLDQAGMAVWGESPGLVPDVRAGKLELVHPLPSGESRIVPGQVGVWLQRPIALVPGLDIEIGFASTGNAPTALSPLNIDLRLPVPGDDPMAPYNTLFDVPEPGTLHPSNGYMALWLAPPGLDRDFAWFDLYGDSTQECRNEMALRTVLHIRVNRDGEIFFTALDGDQEKDDFCRAVPAYFLDFDNDGEATDPTEVFLSLSGQAEIEFINIRFAGSTGDEDSDKSESPADTPTP